MSARWADEAERRAGDGRHPTTPRWSAPGDVPMCDDGCYFYDGKRCELLGQRPAAICEPVVAAMASLLAEAERR